MNNVTVRIVLTHCSSRNPLGSSWCGPRGRHHQLNPLAVSRCSLFPTSYILDAPDFALRWCILLRTMVPGFSLVLIYINLLAESHQPQIRSYKSRLAITSTCPLSESGYLPSSPHLLNNPSIVPPVLHVAFSSLHPCFRTLRICHLHLRITSMRRKWGACR